MRIPLSAVKVPHSTASFRASSTFASIRHELLSRPKNITYDYLSPTPSHLLNISLADFLPQSCYPNDFSVAEPLPLIQSAESSAHLPRLLPQGHHIVYFPPPIPDRSLHPDYTDKLHSPAEPTPFVRRMWAGGEITFNPLAKSRLYLDGSRVLCVEGIKNVTIKGPDGDEKIFVHIERLYGRAKHSLDNDVTELGKLEAGHMILTPEDASVVERRDLVFMREKPPEDAKQEAAKTGRIVKPPHTADFTVTLTPPPSLLFRFSALTFNAHRIHLDTQYSREVEGHRNLLVHGPLSLVLMLSVLRSQLKEGELIASFSYRNLAPLYTQEEMRIGLRRKVNQSGDFEVWIEGQSGGYAVKGSASVRKMEPV